MRTSSGLPQIPTQPNGQFQLLQYNWSEQKLFSHENSEVFAYVAALGVWNYPQ